MRTSSKRRAKSPPLSTVLVLLQHIYCHATPSPIQSHEKEKKKKSWPLAYHPLAKWPYTFWPCKSICALRWLHALDQRQNQPIYYTGRFVPPLAVFFSEFRNIGAPRQRAESSLQTLILNRSQRWAGAVQVMMRLLHSNASCCGP